VNNLQRYKADLEKLIGLGREMFLDIADERKRIKSSETGNLKSGLFEERYQRYYSEATAVLRQLLPSRLAEFEVLYKGDGKRKTINAYTYNIQDWLLGTRAMENSLGEKVFNDYASAVMRFQAQTQIIESMQARFESVLFEIHQLVQADLFDSELEAARALLKQGFLRAAGVIAGVVLETHLQEVCGNHSATIKKKNPTIGDLNDILKEASVLDVPAWRSIQRLGDLRNLRRQVPPAENPAVGKIARPTLFRKKRSRSLSTPP
jgi:hypothetical protein